MHTNENLTIGLLKESMIKIVLVNSFHKHVKMLEELHKNGKLCIAYKRITE